MRYILILEDNARRLELLRDAAREIDEYLEVVAWDDAGQMRKEMEQYLDYAVITSLDFDLGNSRSNKPGNGMLMAQHLAAMKPLMPVIVHSSALSSGAEMVQVLQCAGWEAHGSPVSGVEELRKWGELVERLLVAER